ncbi:MAG: sulfotransferase domain-containing protein [Thermodesulfobacteriota bacterium]
MTNQHITQAILWGLNDDTRRYLELLAKAGITCRCIVDTYNHSPGYHEVPVLSAEQYKQEANLLSHIPVLVIARSKSGESRFAEVTDYIKNFLDLKEVRILHPVCLADYIDVTFPHRVYICGFPGSGNIFVRALTEKLLTASEQPPHLATTNHSLLHHLAREHHELLIKTLNALFLSHDLTVKHESMTHADTFVFSGAKKNEFVRLFNIKSKRYLCEDICSRHDFFEDHILDTFQRLQYKIIAPIRNPLDTLISNAFKYEYTTIFIDRDAIPDASKSGFKQALGHARLSSYKWFHDLAQSLHRFYTNLLQASGVYLIKYEDLISQPYPELKNLASFLGQQISDETIENLWQTTAFRPLSNQAHYFQPGMDKWRKYLNNKHIEILAELGFANLMKELGYQFPTQPLEQPEPGPPETHTRLDLFLSLHDHIQHINFRKNISFPDDQLTYCMEMRTGLGLLTNQPHYATLLNAIEQSSYIQSIFTGI